MRYLFDMVRKACPAGVVGIVAALAVFSPMEASATGGQGRLTPPVLSCADSTQVSLDVQVCGGTSGTPVGFGLRWLEGDTWVDAAAKCNARFGRKINRLKPGECVTVNLGELIAEEANHYSCAELLKCGTDYTIKGWAFATATQKVSPKSSALVCTTVACTPPSKGCTFTQGYWDSHGPVPKGNNDFTWPEPPRTAGLSLGVVPYTPTQLQSILQQPTQGNGLVSLAHQLIAAKLNVANGADATAISTTIASADALIGTLVVPPVGTGSLTPAQTASLNETLTDYNEGAIGPGHCPP
ncbi:MAG: hypothetical protein U1E17_18955 [Geminicoccaceae bacterium]